MSSHASTATASTNSNDLTLRKVSARFNFEDETIPDCTPIEFDRLPSDRLASNSPLDEFPFPRQENHSQIHEFAEIPECTPIEYDLNFDGLQITSSSSLKQYPFPHPHAPPFIPRQRTSYFPYFPPKEDSTQPDSLAYCDIEIPTTPSDVYGPIINVVQDSTASPDAMSSQVATSVGSKSLCIFKEAESPELPPKPPLRSAASESLLENKKASFSTMEDHSIPSATITYTSTLERPLDPSANSLSLNSNSAKRSAKHKRNKEATDHSSRIRSVHKLDAPTEASASIPPVANQPSNRRSRSRQQGEWMTEASRPKTGAVPVELPSRLLQAPTGNRRHIHGRLNTNRPNDGGRSGPRQPVHYEQLLATNHLVHTPPGNHRLPNISQQRNELAQPAGITEILAAVQLARICQADIAQVIQLIGSAGPQEVVEQPIHPQNISRNALPTVPLPFQGQGRGSDGNGGNTLGISRNRAPDSHSLTGSWHSAINTPEKSTTAHLRRHGSGKRTPFGSEAKNISRDPLIINCAAPTISRKRSPLPSLTAHNRGQGHLGRLTGATMDPSQSPLKYHHYNTNNSAAFEIVEKGGGGNHGLSLRYGTHIVPVFSTGNAKSTAIPSVGSANSKENAVPLMKRIPDDAANRALGRATQTGVQQHAFFS